MSSTTTETVSSAPKQNPKDSLKSTWRTWDRATWSFYHWPYEFFNIYDRELNEKVPVHEKTDKVPRMGQWSQHRYVLFHALIPMAIQQLYVTYSGHSMHPALVSLLYALAFQLNGIHEFNVLRKLTHKFGSFDGDKHERDGVPDHAVWTVLNSLIGTATFRVIMTVFLSYTRAPPTSVTYWLPLEIGLYGIVLDFWFYWYHRLMHDVTALWKHHRTHHLTKHPNPLLTLYADHEQEFFDIIGIPFLAWASLKLMGLPMNFYDWWICHQYVVFAELAGHSGLRIHASPPNTLILFLKFFNAELVIEDHDLHHRYGWKHSFNYGKQTRLWDRVFGTCRKRIESGEENTTIEEAAVFPLF